MAGLLLATAFAVLLSGVSASSSFLAPSNLTVEYLTNPLGVDVYQPRFGWKVAVANATQQRGQVQSAYRVVVTVGNDSSVVAWDSGVVASNASAHVVYNGSALQYDQLYAWTVQVWDGNGSPSPASAPATFTTALSSSPAVWIGGLNQLRTEVFLPNKPIQRASAFISGLGCYELHINGERVGDNIIDPGFTVYTQRTLYSTFDVTALLTPNAGNAFGAWIGNCKYGYLNVWCADGPDKCRTFWLHVSIRFADGTAMSVVSDTTWKIAQGPILYDSLYNGEQYDARLEQPGWDRPNFDDSAWQAAVAMNPSYGALTSQLFPPIKIMEEFTPVSVTEPKPGVFVFDFGQNFAGFTKLNAVTGPAGTLLALMHGELLNADGTVDNTYAPCPPYGGINCANQNDTYTLKGDGVESYQPHFTYHGFRYVQLTGFPGTPTAATLTAKLVRSSVSKAAFLDFPTDYLNKLQSAIFYTESSNVMSHPTDCPQREKRGWMGDGQVTCEQAMINLDMAAFYANWVRSMTDDQTVSCVPPSEYDATSERPRAKSSSAYRWHVQLRDAPPSPPPPPCYEPSWAAPVNVPNWTTVAGSIPDVVPFTEAPFGGFPGDPTWAAAYIVVPYYVYKYYGDTRILAENYDGFKAYLNFLSVNGDNGLARFAYYGDWLAPENTDKAMVASFFHILCVEMMTEIAVAVGASTDADFYAKQYAALIDVFNTLYYNPSDGFYSGGTLTALSIVLEGGIVPPTLISNVSNALYEHALYRNLTPFTGLVGTRYLLQALTRSGRGAAALSLATTTQYPSWGYMLAAGATTIWETWDGSGSRNHPMFTGGLGVWLTHSVVGLRPGSPGWGTLLFAPDPAIIALLGQAAGTLNTIAGTVSSSWHFANSTSGSAMSIVLSVPVSTEARVAVPLFGGSAQSVSIVESTTTVWSNGKFSPGPPGIIFASVEGPSIVFIVGSGSFSFAAIYED